MFGGGFDLEKKESQAQALKEKTLSEGFWDHAQEAQKISKELSTLENLIQEFKTRFQKIEDAELLAGLAQESGEASDWEEADAELKAAETAVAEAEFEAMLSAPEDQCSAVLAINAGAGGTESCDWVSMLLRMYLRYAERKGYRTEIVDYTYGEGAGYRSVTVTIEGPHAFGYLKAEIGVHRLVRISPFDANKRRHTSFASVFVYPLINDEIVIEINPTELRIDTFRAGGAGGQNVQKNETACRILHIPTGIIVQCQNERSLTQNRETAMKILKSRLYEVELEKKRAKQKEIEDQKQENTWGSQIRSYVLHPYKMVKDHRTDHEMGDADRVLDGDLEGFIKAYLLRSF